MVGCRGQETLVVGVAAHDTVQHHDISLFDAAWVVRDVVESPLRLPLDASLTYEPRRFLLVTGCELQVERARGPALQRFELEIADAAPDLENRRALEPTVLEKRKHALRRLVHSALPITLGRALRLARCEKAVATTSVAASGHCRSLGHLRWPPAWMGAPR